MEVGARGAAPTMPAVIQTDKGLLVADVRLYDDVEQPSSDASRLGMCIDRVGAAGLADLHGDFAFAYWDHAGRSLMLGRDHFGARPLQFTIGKGHVAFASLPSGLLRPGFASRNLDEAVIASFPVNGQPIPGRTFFKSVQSVRPAHVACIDARGRARQQRYWRLPLEAALPLDIDPIEAAGEVRRLLDQAVRRRLPAAGPAASHMSGGLDSTPIAVLAARALREQGRNCLAYSFQEARLDAGVAIVDETPFVTEAARDEPNLILKAIPSRSHFSIIAEGVDPDTMLPLAADEPEEALLKDASAQGASILLSGWGGDQVVTSFGGGMEGELFRAGRWTALARELANRSRQTGRPRWREFASRVVFRSLPPRVQGFLRRRRAQDSWNGWDRFVAPGRRASRVLESRPRLPDSRATRRVELEAWWIGYRLEMFAQQGIRHGIAYAYPMLDLDLLRYAMRLPGTVFRREGVPRRLIRDALEGVVPDSIRWREEKYAPYPVEALRVAEEREAIVEAVRDLGRLPLVRDFIDPEAVVAYLREGRSPEQIRTQMAVDAANGMQFTSAEEDHQFALQLAYFLKAQAELERGRA
jgi:asparagine synthase (glutamine-hydrolysing)